LSHSSPEKHTRKYVLFNDTGLASHHGCRAVCGVIHEAMKTRGFRLIGAMRSGSKWRSNRRFLKAAAECDLIIVNGEGTMHSGSVSARSVIDFISEHGRTAKAPIALINTIWERNPEAWYADLNHVQIISARDRSSQRTLTEAGFPARYVPDLSLTAFAPGSPDDRSGGIGWCDSVNKGIAAKLEKLASSRNEPFLPLHARLKHVDHADISILRRKIDALLHRSKLGLKYGAARNIRLFEDAAGFYRSLQTLDLVVSGRFHGTCLALLAGTPFIAIPSNTRKIEQLVADAGLDARRIVSAETFFRDFEEIATQNWDFSAPELANRMLFLQHVRTESERLFNDIAALAKSSTKT
jgi:polysaccharide pyruvyl transferase WcaK-like protein